MEVIPSHHGERYEENLGGARQVIFPVISVSLGILSKAMEFASLVNGRRDSGLEHVVRALKLDKL
jgi:hypothetical protein